MAFFEFLGTGTSQGVPVIGSSHPVCLSENPKDKRLRSSFYLHLDDVKIIIDCGPDFRQQLLRSSISYIDAILLTHEHNDHVLGLDDVRPLNFLMGKYMPIYGLSHTLEEVRKRFPYAFAENKYPGAPGFDLFSVEQNELFYIKNTLIEAIPILHGSMSILGYRIKNVCYITDASHITDEVLDSLQGIDYFIVNSLRKEKEHTAHYILPQSLAVIEKIKPKQAYITHISHLMGFHNEVQKELPKNVQLAYDGLKVTI